MFCMSCSICRILPLMWTESMFYFWSLAEMKSTCGMMWWKSSRKNLKFWWSSSMACLLFLYIFPAVLMGAAPWRRLLTSHHCGYGKTPIRGKFKLIFQAVANYVLGSRMWTSVSIKCSCKYDQKMELFWAVFYALWCSHKSIATNPKKF